MPRTSLESAGRAAPATGYSRTIKASERGGAPHTHTRTNVHQKRKRCISGRSVPQSGKQSVITNALLGAMRSFVERDVRMRFVRAPPLAPPRLHGCCSPSSALNNGSRRRHRVWVPLVPPAFGPLPASRRRRPKKQSWLANRPTLGFGSCKQIAFPQRRQWAF